MNARPYIVVADDEPEHLTALADALTRRYSADYQVVTHLSPQSALNHLELLKEEEAVVALIIADQRMPSVALLSFRAEPSHLLFVFRSRPVRFTQGDKSVCVIPSVALLSCRAEPRHRLFSEADSSLCSE